MGGWPTAVSRAGQLLDDWRARHPRDPLALWLLADYHLVRNEFESAADAAREGQRLAPDNPELALRLGRALDGLGRHEEALRAFDRSLELRPALPAHSMRARCLGLHLGQRERGLRELAEADRQVPLNSRRSEDWWEFAIAYGELGAPVKYTIRINDAWVREMPGSSFAYFSRGMCRLWEARDYRGAVDDCTRALELGSIFPPLYSTRAEAHVRLEHFDEALADMESLIHGPLLPADRRGPDPGTGDVAGLRTPAEGPAPGAARPAPTRRTGPSTRRGPRPCGPWPTAR